MNDAINELLGETAKCLCAFLEEILPVIGGKTWWDDCVMKRLSYQQERRVEQGGNPQISALDLAALLRVLDGNWNEISNKKQFRPEARHYAKEMQTIRNRWAHAGIEKYPAEDVYRDLDTLIRFLEVISGDESLLQRVREERKAASSQCFQQSPMPSAPQADQDTASPATPDLPPPPSPTALTAISPPSLEPTRPARFSITQMVRMKSDPSAQWPVLKVNTTGAENRYEVYMGGAMQWIYESQIEAADDSRASTAFVPLDQFHAHLTAMQIQHPSLSMLYSLNAARVDFIPYQFRPVLKFIRADRPRLLIADGVGVGKTIEAGLILRELQARSEVRSVLIICPRPLVAEEKWVMEMRRFDERFTQLNGETLRFCIHETGLDGQWPDKHAKIIIPYSLFDEALLFGAAPGSGKQRKKRGQTGLLDLDPPPQFDLVIVDEAHHVRHQSTYAHQAVSFFCENAKAVLFLTATPIQMGSDNLFVLLNLLRPDLVIDRESFAHMAAPNPFINRAVDAARAGGAEWQAIATDLLREAAQTPYGTNILTHSLEFQSAQTELQERALGDAERVAMINRLEGLHTFAGIINRTRRRDIGDFAVRENHTVEVSFTPEQQQLHDDLLAAQAEILSRIHPSCSIKFMMSTIRRQAASCIFGLAPMIGDILHRRLDNLAELNLVEEGDMDIADIGVGDSSNILCRIGDIAERAGQLDDLHDPKLESLQKIISDKQSLPNNKLMVFSTFRHTLRYLHNKLKDCSVRIGLVHGDVPDEERVALRNRFKAQREAPEALDVLLFSEVGCEGLDYQFCDCIVNYDLPWNPMRVEQRIGRIDRNGQKSEKVLIYNLITPGTVDADIYERCLLRIGIFSSALGACDEILGEITQEIRKIAENFQLTPEERQDKLQQLSDNKIRLIREQQELEDRQTELFGIRLPADQFRKDIEEASSFWLSAASLQNLISNYLCSILEREQEFILGEKSLKTLRISKDDRQRLLRDYQQLPRIASPVFQQWERWLKGDEPHLAITFDAREAVENADAAFIMPIHPLARQAACALDMKGTRLLCALAVNDDNIAPGKYPFAIYEWRHQGIRKDLILRPVAEAPEVETRMMQFMEYGRPISLSSDDMPPLGTFESLDDIHHARWEKARSEHQEETLQKADQRRESLTISHRARMALLEEQRARATHEKIARMKQSEINRVEIEFQNRLETLNKEQSQADILHKPVAYGVIVVHKSNQE